MTQRVVTVALKFEDDIVLARQRARQLARLLGFDAQDQTRIATSVSEIARNAFRYAGGGKVEFGVEGRTSPQLFEIVVSDEGPGIARLSDILDGSYRSSTGMGLGIIGARRLMDQFEITSAPGKGTRVVLCKLLPGGTRFRRLPMVVVNATKDQIRAMAMLPAVRSVFADRTLAIFDSNSRGLIAREGGAAVTMRAFACVTAEGYRTTPDDDQLRF